MTRQKALALSELVQDQAVRVELDGVPIAIVLDGQGEVHAIGDTCTHEEASLAEGDVFGDCVECPLHGAEFDLKTGKARTLPAVVPVATYPVKVEGDDVLVGVGD